MRRKPKVAILATGDEVMPPGSELGPDQIVSSVPYGLAALIEAEGGEPMRLGIAKDEPTSLVTLASTGSAADILVTIGGASVGERDLVASALRTEGLELDFCQDRHAAGQAPALRPRMGAQRVLGLAGNPVSALISAHRVPEADASPHARACRSGTAAARGGPWRGARGQRRRVSITCGRCRNGARRTARASCAPFPRRTLPWSRRSLAPTASSCASRTHRRSRQAPAS